MRRLGPTLSVALVVSACGAQDVVLEPAPSFDEALATLYVVERDDDPPRLFAAGPDAARPFSLGLGGVSSARITALGYPRDLGALGLEAGEVTLVSADRCRSRPLPEGAALHTLRVLDGEPGRWASAAELPAELEALRIDGPCPCRAFEPVSTVDLAQPAIAYFGDPANRGLLLLHEDGGMSSFDEAGSLRVVETSTKVPVQDLSALTRAPDGTTWLANRRGEVLRGRLGEAFEPQATVSGGGDFVRNLAVGTSGGINEVYGVTEIGYVVGIEPDPPAVLARPQGLGEVSNQRARTLWLGPGRIVAAPPTRLELIFVTEGREAGRVALPSSSGGARFLADVPDLGIVVLGHDALVLELDGLIVRDRPDAPVLSTPTGLLTFDGGYLYSGEGGYVQEYRIGYGFCPTQYLEGRSRVLGVVFVGERLAFIAYGPGGGVQVALYETRPLEP